MNKELLGTLHTFKTVGELVNFLSDFKADTPLFTDNAEYPGTTKDVRIIFESLKESLYEDGVFISNFEDDRDKTVCMCFACGY